MEKLQHTKKTVETLSVIWFHPNTMKWEMNDNIGC